MVGLSVNVLYERKNGIPPLLCVFFFLYSPKWKNKQTHTTLYLLLLLLLRTVARRAVLVNSYEQFVGSLWLLSLPQVVLFLYSSSFSCYFLVFAFFSIKSVWVCMYLDVCSWYRKTQNAVRNSYYLFIFAYKELLFSKKKNSKLAVKFTMRRKQQKIVFSSFFVSC